MSRLYSILSGSGTSAAAAVGVACAATRTAAVAHSAQTAATATVHGPLMPSGLLIQVPALRSRPTIPDQRAPDDRTSTSGQTRIDRSLDPTPEGVKKRNNSIHSAEFRWGRVPAWTGTHVQRDIPQAAPVGSPCP